MDPVTHTLVGAALARSGLGKNTSSSLATCVIGANLPDLDVLSYLWGGATALGFRRGLTHGLAAMLLLPVALTACITLWDWIARKRRTVERPGIAPRQVLLLATVSVATHPLLDSMNVYGMRWLVPFSTHWSYGDALFIVDPWVWAILVGGLWLSHTRIRAATTSLVLVATYAAIMGLSGLAARRVVVGLAENSGISAERVMAAPIAVTPLSRWVVIETQAGYQVGLFSWLAPSVLELTELPFAESPPAEFRDILMLEPEVRSFLSWARFPFYLATTESDGYRVYVADARYTVDPEDSWAAISVRLRRPQE